MQESAAKPTLDVMRERLHHLATIDRSEPPNTVEWDRWADTRLERWIVDWCLRTGKERTAKKIAEEKRVEVRHQPLAEALLRLNVRYRLLWTLTSSQISGG